MEKINCPVCGEENPGELENCQHCKQALRQSTSELNGAGKLIDSGHTPTAKETSELEHSLPAWLKNARQGENKEEEPKEEEAPPPPPSEPKAESEEPEVEKEDDSAPLDWLSGLDSDEDDDEEEAADWLVNLQGDLAPEEDEEIPEGIPAVDEPITAGDAPRPSAEEEPPIETGELPGWVSDLQGDEKEENADALPDLFTEKEEEKPILKDADTDDGELPDWLSTLSKEKDSTIEPSIETSPVQPVSAQEADAGSFEDDTDETLPDWMGDLQSASETEISSVEDAAPIISDNDDLPDWLSGDDAASAPPVIEEAKEEIAEEISLDADGELPDWMSDLQASGESEETFVEDAVPIASSDDDLPDWLSGDDTASGSPVIEEEKEVVAEEVSLDPSGELPDWMSDLQGSDEIEDAPPVAEEKPAVEEEISLDSEGELPDWMSDLQGSEESEDITPPISEEKSAEEEVSLEANADLPDWMSDLQAPGESEDDTPPAVEESVEKDSLSADEDVPDWVGVLTSADDAVGEDADSPGDEDPEWLSALPADDFSAQGVDDAPEAEASSQAFDTSDELLADAEEADVPDWLSKMGEPATGPLDEAKLEDSPFEEEKPDWLDGLPATDNGEAEATPSASAFLADDTPEESVDDDIFGIETPDWLSSLGPEDVDDEFPAAEAEVSDSAGDAELPSWVQAMRPVADVVADSSKTSDEQVVAETGPLAGLTGVLPANPGLGPLSKPRAHSIKLQVAESQQSSAAILEELLAKESQPSPFKAPKETSSIPLLRWIIASLLLLGVVFSLLSKTEMVASPASAAFEVQESFKLVNDLPAGGSALIVFDYEAAFSTEMKIVAAPLIKQLMTKSEMLITLSTSPMGPALAKNSLAEIVREPFQLIEGENYIDLGYLPGDASGMLGFATDPRVMAPKRIAENSVWELPPLQNIRKFSDFSVIIILTDDVEKGRNWIEQSSLALNDSDTPLLLAVSAQAEPMLYPYYASGQVDGLLSGLSGGATYERLKEANGLAQEQDGFAREYWDSYSVGLFLAEILIAVGAMVNFLAALKSGQKSKEEK
ncbi:MAG: hypothetical protein GY755_14205 [Chloroflexi bacterium]|nr:hypothetical protein [Chloroflexota bacterium]